MSVAVTGEAPNGYDLPADYVPQVDRMARKVSERQRWVTVYYMGGPFPADANGGTYARKAHKEAQLVVEAFRRVGRVVRIISEHGSLVLKARRGS